MHLFSRAFPTASKALLLTLIGIQSISADVVINEIHYDEDNKTVRSEFIELFNPSNDPVDLSGYYFSSGIDFEFPAGTILTAGGYVVISENPATMLSHFGYSGALGPFANESSLKNSGENITNKSGNFLPRFLV